MKRIELNVIFLLLLVVVGIVGIRWIINSNHMEVTQNNKIDVTPQQITSIKNIGQWEFLSVHDEELVDTTASGMFRDRRLARIYYGTLRLGIDMRKLSNHWLHARGDTATAVFPAIELLDSAFIDEALSKPFIEVGHWTDADRAAMAQRARRQMLQRCLTRANKQQAEDNARQQLTRLIQAMGFNTITVTFRP